ncbi:MAG: DUF2178 domain-containing protein [Patescibacteria group bacterium]|nr:DUF2178 domain-containing protein [Patescibacteria group bacterium]
MTLKQYAWIRLVVAACLAAVMSQAVVLKNYYLGGAAVLIAVLLMVALKKQVREVMADERDYKLAGDAARWSLTVFATLGSLGSFLLLTGRGFYPEFEAAGSVLAYAVCALLIIYSLTVKYLQYRESEISQSRKIFYTILGLFVAAVVVVAGLRLFSGEDTWLCQNGQWVKHGNPAAPAPSRACR